MRRTTLIPLSLLAAATLVSCSASRTAGPAHTRPRPGAAVLAAVGFGASTNANPDNLPEDCIPSPPTPTQQLTELGLVGEIGMLPPAVPSTINPPISPGSLTAGPISVTGITAKLCGTVQLVPGSGKCPAVGQVNIPPDGQEFGPAPAAGQLWKQGPFQADVNVVPGMTPKVPFSPVPHAITGKFVCDASGSSSMGLTVSTAAVLGGSAGLFGLGCDVTISITFTATVTGGPIDAPFALQGDFASSDFRIPDVTASTACPEGVANNFDLIAGLPLNAGTATINLPFAASLYAPD